MLRIIRCCAAVMLGMTFLVAIDATAAVRHPSVSISFSPTPPGPAMLGTSIVWTATVNGGPPGDSYDYQFSVTPPNGPNQIVRDFDVLNSFVWAPWQVEGTYTLSDHLKSGQRLSLQNRPTGLAVQD